MPGPLTDTGGPWSPAGADELIANRRSHQEIIKITAPPRSPERLTQGPRLSKSIDYFILTDVGLPLLLLPSTNRTGTALYSSCSCSSALLALNAAIGIAFEPVLPCVPYQLSMHSARWTLRRWNQEIETEFGTVDVARGWFIGVTFLYKVYQVRFVRVIFSTTLSKIDPSQYLKLLRQIKTSYQWRQKKNSR